MLVLDKMFGVFFGFGVFGFISFSCSPTGLLPAGLGLFSALLGGGSVGPSLVPGSTSRQLLILPALGSQGFRSSPGLLDGALPSLLLGLDRRGRPGHRSTAGLLLPPALSRTGSAPARTIPLLLFASGLGLQSLDLAFAAVAASHQLLPPCLRRRRSAARSRFFLAASAFRRSSAALDSE